MSLPTIPLHLRAVIDILAVDPENRLVALTLEHDWNERLSEVAALERGYAALPRLTPQLVGEEERQRILAAVFLCSLESGAV